MGCRAGEQHSWCSIWNCCVKKHVFEMCTECSELFKCEIFKRRKVLEWIPVSNNLSRIRETGLKSWLTEQKERQNLLEALLRDYNEGRSMNLYCKACSRMPVDLIQKTIKEAEKKLTREKTCKPDIRLKAKIMKAVIQDLAADNFRLD
jgi:hypothetical protein